MEFHADNGQKHTIFFYAVLVAITAEDILPVQINEHKTLFNDRSTR